MRTYRLVAAGLLTGLALALQLASGAVGIQTGWGMTIDLVAVPILIALFVLGYGTALETLLATGIGIALLAPTGYIGAVMKFSATLPMLAVPAAYLIAKRRKLEPPRLLALMAILLAACVLVFALIAYLAFYSGEAFGNSLFTGIAPLFGLAAFSYLLLVLWREYGSEQELRGVFSWKEALALFAFAAALRGLLMIVANFYFAGPLFYRMTPAALAGFIAGVPVPFFGASAWYASIFLWNVVQAAAEFWIAWLVAFRFGFAKRYGG